MNIIGQKNIGAVHCAAADLDYFNVQALFPKEAPIFRDQIALSAGLKAATPILILSRAKRDAGNNNSPITIKVNVMAVLCRILTALN